MRKDLASSSSSLATKKAASEQASIKEVTQDLKDLDLAKSLSVKEDNHVKYVLSAKGFLAEGEDDEADEFGSIDGDEARTGHDEEDEDEDDEAADDAHQKGVSRLDTSKNRHFFVIKTTKPSRVSTQTVTDRYRSQVSYVSDMESELDDEDSSNSSSEDDGDDDDEEDENMDDREDYDDEEDEGVSKKTAAKKKGNTNQDDKHLHREDTDIFYHEVIELLKSGLKEKQDPANIILGKSLKSLNWIFTTILNFPNINGGIGIFLG